MIKEILIPKDIKSAESYLRKYKKSKVLAGGTDLILHMEKNSDDIEYLVSINHIDGLKIIKEYNYHIILGSMVTFTQLMESPVVKDNFQCLMDCSRTMGSPQIRNIATIGGNIVNAAPAADLVPCLMTLGAVFIIENAKMRRTFKCEEYFKNYDKIKINDDEILLDIIINKGKGASGFYKLGKRNSLAISRLTAACYLEAKNDKISQFRLTLGAVGRLPFRLYEVEALAVGNPVSYLKSKDILNQIQNTVIDSIRGRKSLPFKEEAVIGVYNEAVTRALNRLKNETSQGVTL